MKKTLQIVLMALVVVAFARPSEASSISIYTAPDKTYGNTANSPCIFYGPGQSGCNKDPQNWVRNTDNTDGAFPALPLTQTYTGVDKTLWDSVVGSTFVLGYDVNDTSTPQSLETMTIEFFNGNVSLGGYTFSPTTATPSNANGNGYADFILSAGCAGTTVGSGITATCVQTVPGTGPTYTPFVVPNLTTSIVFNFRLEGGNDGSDKIFAIPTDPLGTPTQTCATPGGCDVSITALPEPASLVLMATGLLGAGRFARRRLKK